MEFKEGELITSRKISVKENLVSVRNFLTSQLILASQEGLYSMELLNYLRKTA
jgi:hypothetical protein